MAGKNMNNVPFYITVTKSYISLTTYVSPKKI